MRNHTFFETRCIFKYHTITLCITIWQAQWSSMSIILCHLCYTVLSSTQYIVRWTSSKTPSLTSPTSCKNVKTMDQALFKEIRYQVQPHTVSYPVSYISCDKCCTWTANSRSKRDLPWQRSALSKCSYFYAIKCHGSMIHTASYLPRRLTTD